MKYIGDFAAGATVVLGFNTKAVTDVPTTLAGTPVVSVYKNSTTQSVAGVTLTVDYDSVTGLNRVVIDTSADGTFYAAGSDFDVVVTTGTVNSVSYVGTIVGTFSIANRPVQGLADGVITAAKIASDAITAAKIAAGAIDSATFAADTGLQSIRANTAQAGASTTITLDASASATDNFYRGDIIVLTGGTGAGQVGLISGYVGSTKVATVARAWATNPDNTTTFAVRPMGVTEALVMVAGTLTSSERNSVADALLDRAAGVETGLTPRQILRLLASVIASKVTVSGTTVTFRDFGDTKNRIVATVGSTGDGSRSALTIDAA